MATCAGCLNKIEDSGYLNCTNCRKPYDLLCANITREEFCSKGAEEWTDWKCVQCVSAQPKTGNTNTPVLVRGGHANVNVYRGDARPRAVLSPGGQDGDNSVMEMSYTDSSRLHDTAMHDDELDRTRGGGFHLLVAELRLFREQMMIMTNEIHALHTAMTSLASRIDGCDERIDHLCARVEALESKPQAASNTVDATLVDTISQLRMELNDRDQELLLNDVEISNVPEMSGESPTHLATVLGQKLGVVLTESDIVDATRVGRAPQFEDGVQGPAPRPRLIVVRLARRVVRDRLLQAARVRRGATTEGTGIPGHQHGRFYVNERLTPHNRRLFHKARELKQQYGWRFAWTRDGRIFVRQRPGSESPRHRIRSELDLERVFGPRNV